MERNYLRPDALMELDFITESNTKLHRHENLELLFVISGSITIMVEDDSFQMNSGDMIVVNMNHKHCYQGTEELVLARFIISYNKVQELLGIDHVVFWCNSVTGRKEAYEAYDDLGRIIGRIFNQKLYSDGRSKIYLKSLYYQLLCKLVENFMLSVSEQSISAKKNGSEERFNDILAFLQKNYRRNITLGDLAGNLYISTTYVSRYIKKKCGINFIALLNSVRLSHATEDILFSDDPVMKIALDNGFSSVAAFNKVFREKYDQTPSQFRKLHKNKAKASENGKEDIERQKLVKEKVEKYIERDPEEMGKKLTSCQLYAEIDAWERENEKWDRNACWMINVGTAADLLNANIQRQILEHREQMGFKFVRFWDIYNSELCLNIHAIDGKQNFSRINAIIDFLVENQLKPYIELGFKGRRIIRNEQYVVRAEICADDFADEQEIERFYGALFDHFIQRYGSWEVSQWYFEYWEKPVASFDNAITLQYAGMDESQHRAYFRRFDIIAGALRAKLPKGQIGGAGFPVRIYGENGFACLLALWKQYKQQPDFLTISCYPYKQELKDGNYYEKRFSDMSFVLHGIELTRSAMQSATFDQMPIHVTEYSMSLSSRNVLNDSCLKAAYLLNNTIECIGKVQMLGHFFYTDAFAEEKDTDSVLFGGNGFLTKDGISKPSYYAMEFLNQLYVAILKKHSNYLITGNDRGSIRLVCHNLKKPNYSYYLKDEDQMQMKDIPGVLNDREFLKIHMKMRNAKEGRYIIKTSVINSHHGSVQDKWISMNMESELTKKEIDYLQMSSISDISIQEVESRDGVLGFLMELEPNEIRYVHIYHK